MIVKTIDLYEYFGENKPENARGYLVLINPGRYKEYGIDRKRPAVLVIPGGGYQYTSEREAEPVAFKFLAQGYVPFILYYSVVPAKYPQAFKEASMAMVYIRENAEELGILPDKVSAIGFSAGGHLCGCLATLTDDSVLDFLEDKKPLAKPNACALMYPVITMKDKTHVGTRNALCGDNEELYESLSLESRVTKNSVPAYIFSTLGDESVPCKNSLLMACAYEKAGVPFSLHILEKGGHGLSVNDVTSDTNQALKLREPSSPANYNDWIGQLFTWLDERGFKPVTE